MICLTNVFYVLADKKYDSDDIVRFISKELKAKAAIPINKLNRGNNYTWKVHKGTFKKKEKEGLLRKVYTTSELRVRDVSHTLKEHTTLEKKNSEVFSTLQNRSISP